MGVPPGVSAPHLYLTHPQVLIDPAVPVPDWGLSPVGRERAEAFARSGRLAGVARVVSSAERKAVETAEIAASALGTPVEIRPGMHENDRSATGYLPQLEFERMADRFFGWPQESVRGWERAVDAQARIVREVAEALATDLRPTLFVGHGGVGALLLCHLSRRPISRADDQLGAGGGCVFAFRVAPAPRVGAWRTAEVFAAGKGDPLEDD